MHLLYRAGWVVASIAVVAGGVGMFLAVDSLLARVGVVVLFAPFAGVFARRAIEPRSRRERRVAESKAATLRKLDADKGLPYRPAGPF